MKMPETSLLEWQQRYGTETACAAALAKIRWPKGLTRLPNIHTSERYQLLIIPPNSATPHILCLRQ